MSDPQEQPGLHESDILPFMGNNSAQPPAADNPMEMIMSFLNKGVIFGAAMTIMGALEGGMAQLAGAMPEGTGTEPARAELSMAPGMAPNPQVQMAMNQQPSIGTPS